MLNPTRFALVAASLAVFACTQVACTAEQASESIDDTSAPIVGGVTTTITEWPGAVAVYKSSFACGGSLVAPSWVVTAAHCVTTSSPTGGFTKIIIGRTKLSGVDGESHTVDKAFRHPQYNASRNDNDIALIHLTTPSSAPLTKLVSTAQVAGAVADGVTTTVIGWGTTSAGGSVSDTLRKVDVPVISNAKCKAFSGYSSVADNSFCAGLVTGGKDSCQGDSGGPIFQSIGGRLVEVGLVSWGIGCAGARAPGVYTRVGNYLSWLNTSSNGEINADAVTATVDAGAPLSDEPTATDTGL